MVFPFSQYATFKECFTNDSADILYIVSLSESTPLQILLCNPDLYL